MRRAELKVNGELNYYGKEYIILSIEPPNVYIKRKNGDGETIIVSFYDLVSNPSFRPSKSLINELEKDMKRYMSELDCLSDKKREEVKKRLNIIRPLLLLDKIKSNDIKAAYEFHSKYGDLLILGESMDTLNQKKLLQQLEKKYEISSRTIIRYLTKYRKNEYEYEDKGRGEDGLISKSGTGHLNRNDNRQIIIFHPKDPSIILDVINTRLDEKHIPIIKEAIEEQYLTTKRIKVSALHEIIKIRCSKNGLEEIPYSTIYKITKRIRKDIIAKMRDGKKAGDLYDPVDRGFTNEDALYPLHVIQIDHTELDIDVIDDKTGFPIGRPWITLGIDEFSRAIWCLYVNFEPPSANRVRKALEHGIFFKKSKEKYNTLNEWGIFGIPNTIYLDNGPDFKSVEVKRMITETLRANVKYRPVKTPRYGSVIERYFGTINSKLIHRLDGTRKSNVVDLGEYNPDEEAKLTLNDITELLTWYIVDVYHFSEHKSLPLYANNPMARYMEGIEKAGYPEFIYSQDEQAYRIELMATTTRAYTRDGIRLNNILYQSHELNTFIGGKSKQYKIKYDLDDISYIYMLNQETKEYVKVLATYPNASDLEGMSLYTYKKLIEILKEEGAKRNRGIPGTEQITYALSRLEDNIQSKYKKNRSIRLQAKRHDVSISLDKSKEIIRPQRTETINDLISRMKTMENEVS